MILHNSVGCIYWISVLRK